MASTIVSSTYQTYKAGTQRVLYWLYENALKSGYGLNPTETSMIPKEREITSQTARRNPNLSPKLGKVKGAKPREAGRQNLRNLKNHPSLRRYFFL
jgi:hypothetical protein